MDRSKQMASRLREVILNGKWISNTNYKDQLDDVNWEQATTKIGSLNTLAALTFHINYYIAGINYFFESGKLEIRDKFSFDLPTIRSEEDWESLRNSLYKNADRFSKYVEQLSDDELEKDFIDPKYGSYLRNIDGMIEHSYYHLGQVVLIKKMIIEKNNK